MTIRNIIFTLIMAISGIFVGLPLQAAQANPRDEAKLLAAHKAEQAALQKTSAAKKLSKSSSVPNLATSAQQQEEALKCLVCLEICTKNNPNAVVTKCADSKVFHPVCRNCIREAITTGQLTNANNPNDMSCPQCRRAYSDEQWEDFTIPATKEQHLQAKHNGGAVNNPMQATQNDLFNFASRDHTFWRQDFKQGNDVNINLTETFARNGAYSNRHEVNLRLIQCRPYSPTTKAALTGALFGLVYYGHNYLAHSMGLSDAATNTATTAAYGALAGAVWDAIQRKRKPATVTITYSRNDVADIDDHDDE